MADPVWNPFLYPQSQHKRRETPPALKKYTLFRPYVRREFRRRCVYCCMPDGLRTHFAVEHYKPKRKFPHLTLVYSNLFYACPNCNGRKKNYWPTNAQRAAGEFIANPCDHIMTTYVKYDRERVTAKSATGQFMIELLDLNLDEILTLRGFIRTAIRDRLRDRREGQAMVREIDARLATTSDPATRAELITGREEAEQGVIEAENHLRLLLSTDNLAP